MEGQKFGHGDIHGSSVGCRESQQKSHTGGFVVLNKVLVGAEGCEVFQVAIKSESHEETRMLDS